MNTMRCKCGGNITEKECFIDGFLISCMKCEKCDETFFTPEQTKDLIMVREANKEIEGRRKIIKVGSSIAALLPKKVMAYGISEGEVDNVRVLSPTSLEIKFSKEIVRKR